MIDGRTAKQSLELVADLAVGPALCVHTCAATDDVAANQLQHR